MSIATVLILVLVILVIAGGPYTGFHGYGYWPSGLIGVLLLVVLVLALMGRL